MDMARLLNRRRALGLFGAAGGTIALAACGGDELTSSGSTASATPTPTATSTATSTPTPTSTSASCVSFAEETNGPYPADGTNTSNGATSNVLTNTSFVRSDVRSSILASTNTAAGIELTITLQLADVNNDCAVLEGYAVYMWHCNAEGDYSLYDLPQQDYLRGIQVSNANGQVTFTTIIPGCYNGRYPHIHFEVFSSLANATGGRYAVLISQFAVLKSQLTTIYASNAVYASSISALSSSTLSGDNVFGDNTSAQQDAMMLTLVDDGDGTWSANATVGIAT
ncbi:MAG: intradiol ring-cleavage dioxygenase [Sphingomonadales bacterium 32-64-17]|nr:MAG: intradiol ring-cleavage dioxygenase [Sphingomonadales bacterium 32-64-17]